MNREFERRKVEEREAFLSCLIHESFPASSADDVLFVLPDVNQKPVLDFASKTDVIILRPSKSFDDYGRFDFGLVRGWVLLDWLRINANYYVVDLHGINYPAIVDRRLVIFDSDLLDRQLFDFLDHWSLEHQKEIEEYEMANLLTVFGRKWIPRTVKEVQK